MDYLFFDSSYDHLCVLSELEVNRKLTGRFGSGAEVEGEGSASAGHLGPAIFEDKSNFRQ